MTSVMARACTLAVKLIHSSGPRPWCTHSEPRADTTSLGRGSTTNGDCHQISRKTSASAAIRICRAVRETARFGRNASASSGFSGEEPEEEQEEELEPPDDYPEPPDDGLE